jgi:hypothetical protein
MSFLMVIMLATRLLVPTLFSVLALAPPLGGIFFAVPPTLHCTLPWNRPNPISARITACPCLRPIP